MPVYEFYWGHDVDEQFLMEIDADEDTVKKLLDEYRSSDEEYNNFGWCDFLRRKGIKAEIIEAEYYIYF